MASLYASNQYEYFKTIGGSGQQFRLPRSTLTRFTKNLRRVPQVVFKSVKTGFASGFIGLAAQMNYVLGKATEIIDPSGIVDGCDHLDRSESSMIASKWADSWKKTARDGKHSIHLVASFPSGTDADLVGFIIRDTCEELLSQGRNRFEFIAAVHTDTDHPHGHIIVNRRNAEGEWFYLARDHEFTNDSFKDSLVANAAKYGVELNNSSRLSRGIAAYPNANRTTARSGIQGELLDHGVAPFKHQQKGASSYYIRLDTRFGERTIWGVGLAGVLEASGAELGDTIGIKHEGKREIQVRTKDGHTINAHRNDWRLEFNGNEYGSFDTPRAFEPNKNEMASANRRRDLIVKEAGVFQQFGDLLRGSFMSLSIAMKTAGTALSMGRQSDIFNKLNEDIMSELDISEADVVADSNALTAMIETAKEQLDAVWHRIPDVAEIERPRLEQSYFNAVGDMDRLLTGVRRNEFEQRATGSVYSERYREELVTPQSEELVKLLTDAGINPEEFAERMKLSECSHALESHWIEQDAQAIGLKAGINMLTEKGRDEAFRKVADLHNSIMQRALEERNDTEVTNLETLSEIRHLADKDELTVDESEQFVAKLDGLVGDEGVRDLLMGSYAAIESLERAGFGFGLSESFGLAETYYEAMRIQGRELAEAERNLLTEKAFSENSVATIHSLTKKETLTDDESDRLVEHLQSLLGEKGMERLNNADTTVLIDATIEVEKSDAAQILQQYSHALQRQGIDTEQLDQAIKLEVEIITAQDRLTKAQREREIGEEHRREDLLLEPQLRR